MVFGRQTFVVCPGPKRRERNSETPKNLSIDISVYTNSRSFKYANNTIPAKGAAYFQRVSCGFPLNFVLCRAVLEPYSSSKPSVNLWRATGVYVYVV